MAGPAAQCWQLSVRGVTGPGLGGRAQGHRHQPPGGARPPGPVSQVTPPPAQTPATASHQPECRENILQHFSLQHPGDENGGRQTVIGRFRSVSGQEKIFAILIFLQRIAIKDRCLSFNR